MNHNFHFAVIVVALCAVVAGFPEAGIAANNASFTGRYSAERPKNAGSGADGPIIEVVQSEDSIEITRVELGKRTTSRCPFNGPEGDYTSPGGLAGRCKARLKDKTIIIEAVALAHPEPTTTVRMRTKERWQLSRDAKILTIKSDADFTDFPTDISGIVAGNTTTKYTRVENP